MKQLDDLELISISKVESYEIQFKNLLDKFRTKAKSSPSLEEITKENENVRAERYAKEKRIKIILDTNFWISYLISDKIKYLDKFLFSKEVQLIFSNELLEEFLIVSQREKIQKILRF